MNNPFLQKFGPFLGLGIAIVVTVFTLTIAAYLLFWGLLIGTLFYAFSLLRNTFFGKKKRAPKVSYRTFDQATGRWE